MTLPIKWIAARVQIGTAKGAKSVLPHLAQSQDQAKPQAPSNPAASSNSNLRVDPFPRQEARASGALPALEATGVAAFAVGGQGGGRRGHLQPP